MFLVRWRGVNKESALSPNVVLQGRKGWKLNPDQQQVAARRISPYHCGDARSAAIYVLGKALQMFAPSAKLPKSGLSALLEV